MEGTSAAQPIPGTKLQSPDTAILVYRYLEENVESLLGTLRTFILSLNVVRYGDETVQEIAVELLNELFTEALAHSDRYDRSRQLGAWLWGIALNVTRRKKAERAQHYEREQSFSVLQQHSDAANDDTFFDRFASFAMVGPEQEIEAKEQFEFLISLTSEDDQRVLRLAILHDLDNARLAQVLGVKAAAARQRLHRALNRLRAILKDQGGESNE
jgi:RNA polymerase sigma-70 factor, ECF subfamily